MNVLIVVSLKMNEEYYDRLKEYLDDEIMGELIPNEDTYDSDYGWLDLYDETREDRENEEEAAESYDLTIDYLNYLYYQL